MNSIPWNQKPARTAALCLLLLLAAGVRANAGSGKESVTLSNGKTYEVMTEKGYPVNFKGPEIEVLNVGFRAHLEVPRAGPDNGPKAGTETKPGAAENTPQEAQFSYFLSAKIKEHGTFTVTVTSLIDESVSTTFTCRGPGKISGDFFESGKYPALWTWMDKASGIGKNSWMPFRFSFEDSSSGRKFELTQWALFTSADLAQTREQITMLRAILAQEDRAKPGAALKSSAPAEKVVIEFDQREWKVGSSAEQGGQRITEYVVPGETVETWTELVTNQAFPGLQGRTTVDGLMSGSRKQILKACHGAMWKVIEQSDDEVLYEWQTAKCRGFDDQYEVSKLIRGETAVHRVAYTARNISVPEEKRSEWRERIRKAKLESAPPGN